LNRALYGQALADQDRRAALAAKNKARSGVSDGDSGVEGAGSGEARSPRHPFAPQQVCNSVFYPLFSNEKSALLPVCALFAVSNTSIFN